MDCDIHNYKLVTQDSPEIALWRTHIDPDQMIFRCRRHGCLTVISVWRRELYPMLRGEIRV